TAACRRSGSTHSRSPRTAARCSRGARKNISERILSNDRQPTGKATMTIRPPIDAYSQSRRDLFDTEAFVRHLEGGAPPIPLFKDAIRETRARLDQRFRDRGRIEAIIQDLAWFIDRILCI